MLLSRLNVSFCLRHMLPGETNLLAKNIQTTVPKILNHKYFYLILILSF